VNKIGLAPIFSDGMVLQQNSIIKIFGNAKESSYIKLDFCGQHLEIKAEGPWTGEFSSISFGGPFEMQIEAEDYKHTIKDIYIGEVYVAGGQSNMEFALETSLGGIAEALKSDFPQIRYFQVPKIEYEEEGKDYTLLNTPWEIGSSENVIKWSAIAYYFSKKLYEEIKVPIGIINCNWGGTSASSWMKEDYITRDNTTSFYVQEYNQLISKISDEEYENQRKEYDNKLDSYNKNLEIFVKGNPKASFGNIEKNIGAYPWPPPLGKKAYRRPSGLYNTMIKKVIPYSIKGVIWYQGEEDTLSAKVYFKLFNNLIKNWREDFQADIPFFFVQLPSFNDGVVGGDNWAELREAQLETMQRDNNTAMAIAIDCGEKDNVHPINKKPVGERLAKLALKKLYNKPIVAQGPIYESMKISGNKIT